MPQMQPTQATKHQGQPRAKEHEPPMVLTYALQHAQIGRKLEAGPQGKGWQEGIAFTQDSRASADVVVSGMQVRRLTPVECERLQGFPDGYTAIPWRGKSADQCPDGPRYKAIGNSWAVPVARWVGKRVNDSINQSIRFQSTPTVSGERWSHHKD